MPLSRMLRSVLAALIPAFAAAGAAAQTYQVFDVPGANTKALADLKATGINAAGTVTGYYQEFGSNGGDGRSHGFVRGADGTITVFGDTGFSPFPTGINAGGTIVGGAGSGGFVRSPDGVVALYEVPGTGNTQPYAINAGGDIVGSFDNPMITTAFVLTASGALATVPSEYGSNLYAINDLGDAAGVFAFSDGAKGFILARDGTQTLFDLPSVNLGSPQLPLVLAATNATGINRSGSATGYAAKVVCRQVPHAPCLNRNVRGFVRAADGSMTVFQAGEGRRLDDTYARAINAAGTVTGEHFALGQIQTPSGFVRDGSGSITSFQVPDMKATYPTAINDDGVITGYCVDRRGTPHGFVRLP